MNRQIFYKIYEKLQSIIVPTLKYAQTIYEEVLNANCDEWNVWLDLGCGHQLLSFRRLEQEKQLVKKSKFIIGIDYALLSLKKHKTIENKVQGNISNLPFPDDTFDLITSNMVFEHLDNPRSQLKEISRILKSGGKLIFHTPNILSYTTIMARICPEFIKNKIIYFLQGREKENVFRTYYRINSPSKIVDMARSSGFNVSKIKMICSFAQFVILPPIVFFELLWIKFLMTKIARAFRTNIIAILEKA